MIKMYEENKTKLKTAYNINKYIHGGKGILYLESPSGEGHHYIFQKPSDEDAFPDDVIFVYAVHEQKKFYVGMIEDNKFRLTKRSRFLSDTDIVRGAFYIVKMATSEIIAQTSPMNLYHMGLCCRCGRKLKSENALAIGIGSKCLKKLEAR